MDLFIIGDIHGCYHTFQQLLTYWNPQTAQLIQVGDLVDRGNFTAQVVECCRELQGRYPDSLFLKGNHEAELVNQVTAGINLAWIQSYAGKTLHSYSNTGRDLLADLRWFSNLPLYWQNSMVFISHAGLSFTSDPFDEANPDGVLWNRKPLLRLPQMQVHGHTPTRGQPVFNKKSRSWNIDTGACYGRSLTALQLTGDGRYTEYVFVKTDNRDIA